MNEDVAMDVRVPDDDLEVLAVQDIGASYGIVANIPGGNSTAVEPGGGNEYARVVVSQTELTVVHEFRREVGLPSELVIEASGTELKVYVSGWLNI